MAEYKRLQSEDFIDIMTWVCCKGRYNKEDNVVQYNTTEYGMITIAEDSIKAKGIEISLRKKDFLKITALDDVCGAEFEQLVESASDYTDTFKDFILVDAVPVVCNIIKRIDLLTPMGKINTLRVWFTNGGESVAAYTLPIGWTCVRVGESVAYVYGNTLYMCGNQAKIEAAFFAIPLVNSMSAHFFRQYAAAKATPVEGYQDVVNVHNYVLFTSVTEPCNVNPKLLVTIQKTVPKLRLTLDTEHLNRFDNWYHNAIKSAKEEDTPFADLHKYVLNDVLTLITSDKDKLVFMCDMQNPNVMWYYYEKDGDRCLLCKNPDELPLLGSYADAGTPAKVTVTQGNDDIASALYKMVGGFKETSVYAACGLIGNALTHYMSPEALKAFEKYIRDTYIS